MRSRSAGPGAGDGQAAQRVAGRDHAGHRVDAVAGHVAHDQQHLVIGQHQGVVPVAADQVALARGPVADGHVDAGRLDRRRVRRHDGLLQPQGQRCAPRRAGHWWRPGRPGCGSAPRRPGTRRAGPRPGRTASVTGSAKTRIWRMLRSSGWTTRKVAVAASPPFQQALLHELDLGPVGRHHVVVQVGQGDLGPGAGRETEQAERRVGPQHRAADQVLLPAAQPPDALRVLQENRRLARRRLVPPADDDAVVEPGHPQLFPPGHVLGRAVGQDLDGPGEQARTRWPGRPPAGSGR